MTGLSLAHYRIDAELGRGGMGIVYKATDTKLNRTVALKVLPAAALASEDDRARFFREAQAAAQLHHPNIATVFQIDEAIPVGEDGETVGATDGPRPFIAMEFVEGETVADLIKKGPFPLSQAVSIAGQVAEALKEAHGKDVVHRDIKSANVMLTPDGIAKVLDFGLAKTNQSTMLTRMGSTLGTVAYMSPEQARGQEVDGRTDLYALGTMLYEMVAGRLPFSGDYEQAVLYSILNESPEPLTALRTGVPMDMERVVSKLLSKEAEYRYQSAAGLLADLKSLDLTGSGHSRRSMAAMPSLSADPGNDTRHLPVWIWAAMAGIAVFALAAGWMLKPAPPPPALQPVVRFSIPFPEGQRLDRYGRRAIAIDPAGATIAYVTDLGVRIRHTNDIENEVGVAGLTSPRELFFSPDGEWLGFENSADRRLMRFPLSGGSPVTIADLPGGLSGARWEDDGFVYLGLGTRGIARVPSDGGTLEMIIDTTDASGMYQGPDLLPDGHTLVYSFSPETPSESYFEIRTRDLRSGDDVAILERGRDVSYSESGHLVFYLDGSLYAVRFDTDTNAVVGGPFPAADQVLAVGMGDTQYSIAKNGTLVKVRGDWGNSGAALQLAWLQESGSLVPISLDEADYMLPKISPSGDEIVVEIRNRGVWIMDATRGASVVLDAAGTSPIWSPDGRRIAYGVPGAILARDPSRPERVDTLYSSAGGELTPSSWSPDGRTLSFDVSTGFLSDIMFLDLETGEANEFFPSDFDTDKAVFSPDGNWIAYDSNELGSDDEVLVRRFPDASDRLRISLSGGGSPVWRPDGRALYYQLGSEIIETTVSDEGDRLAIGESRQITASASGSWILEGISVHPDGRLLIRASPSFENAAGSVIDVVVNWANEFSRGE